MKTPVNPDPFFFLWPVANAGYEWIDGSDGGKQLVGLGNEALLREPPPTLFRKFAELEATPDAILQFATHHGDLFDTGYLEYVPNERSAPEKGGELLNCTALSKWEHSIRYMRALVHLWDAIDKNKTEELEKFVTFEKDPEGRIAGVKYEIKTPHSRKRARLFSDSFHPRNLRVPARYILQKEINEMLSLPELVSIPRLIWHTDVWDTERDLRLVVRPLSLLGAMWLQFAREIVGKYQVRICVGCGEYFQAGPGGTRRAGAQTCGNRCRQRKHRQKPGSSNKGKSRKRRIKPPSA